MVPRSGSQTDSASIDMLMMNFLSLDSEQLLRLVSIRASAVHSGGVSPYGQLHNRLQN